MKREKNLGAGGIKLRYGLRVTEGQTDVEFEIVFYMMTNNFYFMF